MIYLVYNSFRRAILNLPARLIEQSPFDDLRLLGSTRINRLNNLHQIFLSKSKLYFILSLVIVNHFGGEDWMRSAPGFDDPRLATYEALKSFKEVAKVNGIHPIVAFLPDYSLFDDQYSEENQEIRKQLSIACKELGIPFLDPFENMSKLGINADNALEQLTLVYDPHYSPEGNVIYARSLAPLLGDYFNELEGTLLTPRGSGGGKDSTVLTK